MRRRSFATKTAAVILSAAMVLSASPSFAADADSSEETLDTGAEVILDAEAVEVTDAGAADTEADEVTDADDTDTETDEVTDTDATDAETNENTEADTDSSEDAAFIVSVEEYTGDDLDTEAFIDEDSEEDTESTATFGYGTLSMTYDEFYSALGFDVSSVDAVSSATTSKSSMFANEYTSEVTESGYTIYGVKVPVYVEEGASEDLLAAVTFNADPETAEDGVQYWTVSGDTVTAPTLETKATVTDATATLSTSSNWGDYLVAIDESSTAYLRNTRSDEGFAVGSNILGIVVTTEEGNSYGLTHMNNIWVQTYEFAFNADDANTAGLVGETISTVTYIVPEGLYVYSFAEGIYVKPAAAEEFTGSFNSDGTQFTLDSELSSSVEDATISITYKVSRTTYTLLSTTTIGTGRTFTLETALTDESVPEGTVPTVTISSSTYSDITVSYPMFDWQETELTALVAEANALVTEAEDPAYSYSTLAAHAEEGQEILDSNGSASEAADIISELTELIEAATPYYGTMTLTYEEFYSCLVGDASSVDAVSSATTSKYSMFANESISEVTDDGYTIYGVANVPVKVLPSVTSEQKALITANEEDAEAPTQYWMVNADGVTATTLYVADTVTDATAELSTSSNWGDYLVAITESSTSYLRNSREDTFAVGSNILGIVVTITDGSSYGLTHMNNIWVQTYEFAFNADDTNTAGLVGKTISSVTYIVPDASYVYTFEDGIYVKTDYTATAISGMFSDENTVFTLDGAIPSSFQDATITITYKVGRTTYTLLSETTIGSALSFTLDTAVPETDENGDAVVPTVTISSSNYADIEAYYGGLSWQSDLTACTAVLSAASYTYDGTAKTPAVTVTAADGTVLTEGTDYVVYYSDNVSVGTATVTIIGTGTYGGTLTETFTIKASSSSSSETVKDGLTLDSDGVFRYYENDVFTGTYSGVASYDGGLFFINSSLVDKDANGLCLYDDVWYFVSLGQVQLQYTGLALYDGEWFYITEGILDTTVNGLIPYDGETFLVAAGRLLLDYNGLWLNSSSIGGDDQWYFIAAGQVQNVTQVTMYDGAFFYVVNGILASDYNGTVEYDGAVFTVVAGQLYGEAE
ncbi:MAG: hypothetical protein LUF30_11775 [Lachnospiraceae bacterium]|nr:hypothetical protein [Lachnospiraceae bacterium]